MQKASPRQGTPFFKLHGAGNDLLVLFSKDFPISRKSDFVQRLAHRRLGIGCDQVVEVLSLDPLAIQIWNQDGSRAEMCANGSRSFLFLASLKGWLNRRDRRVRLSVSGTDYEGTRTRPGQYELCLGTPELSPPEMLRLGSEAIPFTPVKTGNPHAVILLTLAKDGWSAPSDFSFLKYGPQIEAHKRFPQRTNVEFVRKMDVRGNLADVWVDVWERGAGPTLSCGSGAVAVAAVVRQQFGVARVQVRMTDFKLQVRFEGARAFLSGPCALVAEGVYRA